MIPVTNRVKSSIILYRIFKSSGGFFQHIAHPYLGIDEFGRKVLFDLLSQEIHVDIDHVRLGIEVDVPDIEGDIDPGNDLVLVADKVFQQLEFLSSQGDIATFAGNFLAVEIHDQIGDLQDVGARDRLAV